MTFFFSTFFFFSATKQSLKHTEGHKIPFISSFPSIPFVLLGNQTDHQRKKEKKLKLSTSKNKEKKFKNHFLLLFLSLSFSFSLALKSEKAKAKSGNSNSKPKAKPRNITTATAEAAKPEEQGEHEEVFVEKLRFIGSLQWLASLAALIRTRRPSRDASVPLSWGLAGEAAADYSKAVIVVDKYTQFSL